MTCRCFEPPFHHEDFYVRVIGVDPAAGRFADVSVETCRRCGTPWLRYFVEYEGFSRSGRWYRGVVSPEQASDVTPESAAALLESLPWYFAGGSYFHSAGERRRGPLSLSL